MPIHGFPGGVISSTAVTPSPTSASGVWTLDEQLQAGANWPVAPSFVSNSLRFRSSASAFLNRTPASVGNRKTWTWSGWFKRGALGSTQSIFTCRIDAGNDLQIFIGSDNKLTLSSNIGGAEDARKTPSMVFRDPSSWYHLVIRFDATNLNIDIYVNGTQVTAWDENNQPSNTDAAINSTALHRIGTSVNATNYLDGYLTDVNFIDGQALTPNYFGAVDAATGVWEPATYRGSYGTNGFYLPFSVQTTSSFAGSFNGSNQRLSGTLTSAVGSGDFTIEGWVYQNTLTDFQTWFSIERGAGGFNIGTNSTGNLTFFSSGAGQISVSGVVRAGTWQHFAFVRSGTTLTAYLNGTSRGTATVSTNFSTTLFFIGALNSIGQETLNGSLSNVRLTGTAVYTSNFTPSTSPLTAVAGTRLLTLQNSTIIDNSGNSISITNTNSVTTVAADPFLGLNIASDQSGNGNNWTTNNISLTAGATYDSMTDVPTLTSATASNFAVMNPLSSRSGAGTALINANLTHSGTTDKIFAGTIASTSGKFYFEYIVEGTTGAPTIGVADVNTYNMTATPGESADSWGIWLQTGDTRNNATGGYSIGGFSIGNILQIAWDVDSGKIWFGKNNTWGNSGNPATDTNPAFTNLTGKNISPVLKQYASGSFNFGQRPFAYTPPTGFVALNTFNLPTPSIGATASTQANKYMNIVTYTGTTATQTITGVGFQPDFTWFKCRSNANSHVVYDAVRGGVRQLYPNLTDAEYNVADGFSAFASDGFTLNNTGAGGNVNINTRTYVAWNWKANGTGVSNTAGSITSTVSANTSAGFSIVTYTGTGSNATVGHGLGVAPKMIIIKSRSGVYNWRVWHTALSSTELLFLNTTDAKQTGQTTAWNSTLPTSTVFSLGSSGGVNESASTLVAYCFSEVAGYSRFGSYTGNGSADGSFIFTGFRPRWVMIKRTDSGNNWFILDTSRDTFNLANDQLLPNSSAAESTGSDCNIDVLSNGFKLRTALDASNGSGGTYIYACFAESPFKYANAR